MLKIDQFQTELLSLAQVAKKLGKLSGNGKVSPATVYRWVVSGLKAPNGQCVRLCAIRVGRTFATSKECVREFLAAMTSVAPEVPVAIPRSPAQRNRESTTATRKLDGMKVGI